MDCIIKKITGLIFQLMEVIKTAFKESTFLIKQEYLSYVNGSGGYDWQDISVAGILIKMTN